MTSDFEKPPDSPALTRAVDLNADLGEGFSNDRALLDRVSSASLSCGAHAGDRGTLRQTLLDAREIGTALGAHPGFPDRASFGRRECLVTSAEVERLIVEQTAALAESMQEYGLNIAFLKPHGALYNQAQRQAEAALGTIRAAVRLGLPLLGQPGTMLEELARERGVRYIAEGFPDRRYRNDGTLVSRGEPDAVLRDPDEIARQVMWLIERGRVQTLCLHGDEPGSVAIADRVRATLACNGIAIRSFLS